MKIDIKNNSKKLLIVLMAILGVAIGFTSAYYQPQSNGPVAANADVLAKTTDVLTFSKGSPISIIMTQQNFGRNANNLTGSTTVTASLLANNNTNSASNSYNVYYNITANEYEYTTAPTNTPELLLTVLDPTGNSVTSISGLTYTTVNGVSGFDITEQIGLIELASNYAISSNSGTTATNQIWTITVTLVNLETNQQGNTDKVFTGQAIIQKEQAQRGTSLVMNQANSTRVGTTDYYTSVALEGTAINNISGIKAYAFTTSSSTPTNWTNLTTVTEESITQNYQATANGTYYFWLKYEDDTVFKKSIEVNQIVSQRSKHYTLYSESSSTINHSATLSGVKALGNIVVDNGSVSNTSLTGEIVSVTVTGGTKQTDEREETLERNPTVIDADEDCDDCECNNGGTLSGTTCVANKGSEYILDTDPPLTQRYNCPNGYYVSAGASSANTPCDTHYRKGTSITYYRCASSNCTHLNGTRLNGTPSTVYAGDSCSTYLDFYWIGSTTCTWMGDYSASCYCVYTCPSSSYTRIGDQCYRCTGGYDFNRPTRKCTMTEMVEYDYWEYDMTIYYYV